MNASSTIFGIVTKLQAALDNKIFGRQNHGFALVSPFNWPLINAANQYVRLDDKDSEYADTLRVRCATLRHFNRLVDGRNEVGVGAIAKCLGTDKAIVTPHFRPDAERRLAMDIKNGRCSRIASEVRKHYTTIITTMEETFEAEQRARRENVTEVFFVCERSDDILVFGNDQLDPGVAYLDEQLADFDQYGYLADSLADKCTKAIVSAISDIDTMKPTYQSSVLNTRAVIKADLMLIGEELGMDWQLVKAEQDVIQGLVKSAADAETLDEVTLAAEITAMNLVAETVVAPDAEVKPKHLVKSPERLAREAEEHRVMLVDTQLKEKAQAKAKRNAKKVASPA